VWNRGIEMAGWDDRLELKNIRVERWDMDRWKEKQADIRKQRRGMDG
jgi:hypothetical protein